MNSASPPVAVIIGAGLIGASIGCALTAAGYRVHLRDHKLSHARVAAGLGAGTIEPPVSSEVGLVIVAVPPQAIGDIVVHATLPVREETSAGDFSVTDLPEISTAATIVHFGSMDDVMGTVQTLARWIDANGYRSTGYNRELYIEIGEDPSSWVTELQEPVAVTG